MINISCGRKLHELVRNPVPPLWAEGYTHQNLEVCPEYVPTLVKFVATVSEKLDKMGGAKPGQPKDAKSPGSTSAATAATAATAAAAGGGGAGGQAGSSRGSGGSGRVSAFPGGLGGT